MSSQPSIDTVYVELMLGQLKSELAYFESFAVDILV